MFWVSCSVWCDHALVSSASCWESAREGERGRERERERKRETERVERERERKKEKRKGGEEVVWRSRPQAGVNTGEQQTFLGLLSLGLCLSCALLSACGRANISLSRYVCFWLW